MGSFSCSSESGLYCWHWRWPLLWFQQWLTRRAEAAVAERPGRDAESTIIKAYLVMRDGAVQLFGPRDEVIPKVTGQPIGALPKKAEAHG